MNLLNILLLGVLCFGCGCIVAEICPPDWHPYKESCYFIVKDTMNWYQANRTCAESRANLAVPNSQSEQDYIWELFLNAFDPTSPSTHLWIGCNDIGEDGQWQHCPLKGQTDSYENWKGGQPSSHIDNLKGCAVVRSTNGQWVGQDCFDDINYAVCEFPVSDTMESSCKQTGPDDLLTPRCLLYLSMAELSDGKSCCSHPRCHSFSSAEAKLGI
ncbi:snaclec bothroinsularin subunit beta-like [Asterias amurensis]|uniref:snaclec bothroinsularin subunit beta-like n=1 Tax=Asterias amurensis TaxID=7602 RepID=UPI003AB3CD43